MISWAALGDGEASALDAPGNIEQQRTEEAELHDLQDKYEAAIAHYSHASGRDALQDVLHQLEDISLHDMFSNLSNPTSEKAHLFFLLMKNIGRVALQLDDFAVAFKAYEAAAHLRINDTSIWAKLASTAQRLGDAWYCRLACEHILSIEPWNGIALRLNTWASKLGEIELIPADLPLPELLPLTIDLDDIGDNWTNLGRQLLACLSDNAENGSRDAICLHSHIRHPSSASRQSTTSKSSRSGGSGGRGLFRSIQRRTEDALEGEFAEPNSVAAGDVPTFIRDNSDATKHTPPLLAEETVAGDVEDVVPPEHEEMQIASQATSIESGPVANPRRSKRRVTRSASDRYEEAVKAVDDSIVAQLETRLSNNGDALSNIGGISFIELAIDALDSFTDPLPVTSPGSVTSERATPKQATASPAASTLVREHLQEFRDAFQAAKPFRQAVEAYLLQTASLIRALGKFTMVSESLIEAGPLCEIVVQLWSWLCEVDVNAWRFPIILANNQPLAVLLGECLAELSSEGLCESYPRELVAYNLNLFTMQCLGELDKGGMGVDHEYQDDLLLRAVWVVLLVNYGAPGSSSAAVPLMSLAKSLFEQRMTRPIYLPHRKQFNEISLERFVLYEQRITVRSTLLQLAQQYNTFTPDASREILQAWLEQALSCLFTDESSDEFRRGCKLRLALESLNARTPFGDMKKLTWLPLQVVHIALRLGEAAAAVRLLQGFLRDVVEMLYSRADVRDDLAQHALHLLCRMDHSCLLVAPGAQLDRLILYLCQLALVAARRTKWTLMKAIQEYSLLFSPSNTIPPALAKLLFGWILDLRTLRMSKKVLSLVADAMTVCRRFSYAPDEHPIDAFASSATYVVAALLHLLRMIEHFKQDMKAVTQSATLDVLALVCTCALRNSRWADAVTRMDLAHSCYVEYATLQGVAAEGSGAFSRYIMMVTERMWAEKRDQIDSERAADIADWTAAMLGQTYYDLYGVDIWADHLAVSLRLPIENERLPQLWEFIHAKIEDGTPRRHVIRSTLQLLRQHPLVMKPELSEFGNGLKALCLSSDGVAFDELAAKLVEYIRATPSQEPSEQQFAELYRSVFPLLVQHMPEIGPQDSVQANENSLIERCFLLLSDLAFNPWRMMSWWNLGLVAQAYHELLSDHINEECIATLLPESAHNPPPAFQIDPWKHQAILEFDTSAEGLLDELQPQAGRLRQHLIEGNYTQLTYCSASVDYLTNALLYKSATRTLALRAFYMFQALLSTPECADQQSDKDIVLGQAQSYEHLAVLAYYSYLELRPDAPMKPAWLKLVVKCLEDGLKCENMAPATRVNLQILHAKVIPKITGQAESRVSEMEAINLAGVDEKRYRVPIVYGVHSAKAKIALRNLLAIAPNASGALQRDDAQALAQALSGLRECRRVDSAEARSVYRIARCLVALSEFVILEDDVAAAFRAAGVQVAVGERIGLRPSKAELMKLFDKKRAQIVGVWFPQQSAGAYEQIEQRTVKFDIRRTKYLGLFLELLERTNDLEKSHELLSWVLSSKAKSAFTRQAATRTLATYMRIARSRGTSLATGAENHTLASRAQLHQAVEVVSDVLSRVEFVQNFPFGECTETLSTLLTTLGPTAAPAFADTEDEAIRLDRLLQVCLREFPNLSQRNLATKRLSKNKPAIAKPSPAAPATQAPPAASGHKRPLEQDSAAAPQATKAHVSKSKKRDASELKQSSKPKQEMKRQRALDRVRAVFVTGVAVNAPVAAASSSATTAASIASPAVTTPVVTGTSPLPHASTPSAPAAVTPAPANHDTNAKV